MYQENKKLKRYFGQHGEDFLLWNYFDFKEKGFFIEIGAFDGKYLSNTYSFEQHGWTGICVEPHPDYFPLCKKNRNESICINKACVGDDRTVVDLHVDPTGLFSGLANDASRESYVGSILESKVVEFDGFKKKSVKACRLDTILSANNVKPSSIDFISIDVEGTEIDVLNGFDLELYNPELIVIESNSDYHQVNLVNYLEEKGYYFGRKLGVNLFFLNSKEKLNKLNDISVRCFIESQIHPLGEDFSVKNILNGYIIDEVKDDIVIDYKEKETTLNSTISKLNKVILELEKNNKNNNRLIDKLKNDFELEREVVNEKTIQVGRLNGEIIWHNKRNFSKDNKISELEELNRQLKLDLQKANSNISDLNIKIQSLSGSLNQTNQNLESLLDEPIISYYLRIKTQLSGIQKRIQPVREAGSAKRKVILNAQYGLGNRLRALASAQLLAEKTEREFVLVWEPDMHCEARFSDLFLNPIKVYNSLVELDISNADCYNYMDSEEGAEKNKFINHKTLNDIYVKSAFVLKHAFSKNEDVNTILQRLDPVQEVIDIVEQYDVNDRVGLHIREGGGEGTSQDSWDNPSNWSEEGKKNLFFWRAKSTRQVFTCELNRLIQEDPNLSFFLAADSEQIYQYFMEQFEGRFIFLKRELFDRSSEQQKYALADMILLSKTRYILGSYWSSFSEVAQRLGGNEIKYSGKDFGEI